MKKVDLVGKTFGLLKVLHESAGDSSRSKYSCLCECGGVVDVFASNLTRGNSTSCGCKFLKSKKYNSVDLVGQSFGERLYLGSQRR